MFQPPQNKIAIKVKDKYIQHMSQILRLASLQNNTSIDPADFVNITGEVVALPKTITAGNEAFSMDNIKVGDNAIFSYQVIYDIILDAQSDKLIMRNMVTYKGQEYFLADITKVFAIIRDGEIQMINGWVMLTEHPKQIIIMANQSKRARGTVVSAIMHIDAKQNKNLKIGDTVCYSPFTPQHYQINGKPFLIMKEKHILGRC